MSSVGADPIGPALGRISRKLDAARSRGLECFGSQKHRFVLRPPLAEAAAARFEREHAIVLPAVRS